MLWIFSNEYASGLTHFTHLVVRFPGKVSHVSGFYCSINKNNITRIYMTKKESQLKHMWRKPHGQKSCFPFEMIACH